MTEKISRKKVYVGLSGGVDSSVSASLLIEQGYDVTGVFIRVWYPSFIECDWKKERRDAMEVCAQLNIPFKELDAEEEYKRDVVDYMISEYKEGRTPNPDIMCNRNVKFGAFKEWALRDGADYIATGHYARVDKEGDIFLLKAGVDKNKDQTYFLWTLTQDDLSKTLFPVGGMNKSLVRSYAEDKGLLTAEKKDSQGVCFLGEIDMKEFLSHYIDLKKGDVLDLDGNVIGFHKGSEVYTIGERHGFDITRKEPNDGPSYIVSKDIKNNTITVSKQKEKEVGEKVFKLCNVNWSAGDPKEDREYLGRVRYRQVLKKCKILKKGSFWKVSFEEPQKFTASGQSLVIYDGDICIGGGVIS